MPHLSSDLCNQMSLDDSAFYIPGEDEVSYPEIVSDETFYGSVSAHLGMEGLDLESEVFDYHFIGDELSYNQDERTVSKNDYFNNFWGENWLLSLKGSSDCSSVGQTENPETPQPVDEVQAIWNSYNVNNSNVEMSDNLNNEFPREDGSKNMFFWKNCDGCFDDITSGNDELYGYIADEGLSEWLDGFSPSVALRER